MWLGVQVLFQLALGFFLTRCSEGLIYSPPPLSSSTGNPPIPQYRFHYYVRDENTGDYKSQEEHRSGDSVTGSYMVGEPNGDLRVVKYVADVANGFKADVNVQPGGSPVKPISYGSKKGIDGFSNQRTGISAPPKQRKPTRGFNPSTIVVKSLSSFAQPPPEASPKSENTISTPHQSSYFYYRDSTDTPRNISAQFTTPVISQKSVQVELTYQDDSVVEKTSEKLAIPEKKIIQSSSTTESTSTIENKNFNLQSLTYLSTEIPTSKITTTENSSIRSASSSSANGLYQLGNMDIPSSVIEILNQQKSDLKYPNSPTYVSESPTTPSSTPAATESTYKPSESTESAQIKNQIVAEFDPYRKANLPQRPMRLIGLSPIYMDHIQLQTITENLTSPSIVPPAFDQIVNMQYATPSPLVSGPLMGGPGPFRNIPRYVSEFADVPQQSNPNPTSAQGLPIINSLPISAPIIPQSSEPKQEGKPAPPPPSPASLPICNDCLLPANYMSYPLLRFPAQPPPTTNTNNNQKPCVTENNPYWNNYKQGFAYILVPPQIIKNNL